MPKIPGRLRPPRNVAPTARLADPALAPAADAHIWPAREITLPVRGRESRVSVRETPPTDPNESGAREPMLCVHGLGGSAHNWTDFAGLLRDRFAVTAVDLPGHGRSGPAPDDDYTLSAHAGVVVALLQRLRDEHGGPVHLVGNSMGGAISIMAASRRPELVRTLTLISPAVPDVRPRIYPLRNDPRMAMVAVPVLGETIMRQFSKRYAVEARAAGTIRLCFADRHRYPKARLAESIAEARDRESMPWADSAFLRSLRGLAMSQFLRGRRAWAAMHTITAPTLVVWGDTDRLVSPECAPYVASAIPYARLLVLDDCGHTAMMEFPDVTARAVVALADDTASASGSPEHNSAAAGPATGHA